jgi:hypothetical protein
MPASSAVKRSKIRKIVPINKTILSDNNSIKRKLVHSIEIKYARIRIINIYSNLISKLYFRLKLPIKKRTDMNTNIRHA